MADNSHVNKVARLYDELAANGPFGTLAPSNRGGRKSNYVAEVFDAALFSELKIARPNDILLDYGCGTGIFSVRAEHIVGKVIGLDISEEMLQWCRRLAGSDSRIEWMLGDGEHIDLDDGAVDWVVAREALCYVPSTRLPAMVAEIVRVMRPGGRFLWLEQTSDDPSFQQHPQAPFLEKRSVQELMQIARMTGLDVLSAYCVRTPRFPWIFPVWFGLLPKSWIPALARAEVKWQRRYGRLQGSRWRDVMLVLRKPEAP